MTIPILLHAAKPINLQHVDLSSYKNFEGKFNNWIHSGKQVVNGLPEKYYIVSGITDAFNQTYGLYNKIGIFNGEYGYHQLAAPNKITTNLNEADVIVISHPFSADGLSSHDKIKYADSYNKPIFIDCAFYGICHNIDFDFTAYNNIHSVCFSLSKSLGTGRHRVGLLYTNDHYPVTIYNDWQYPLLSSAEYHYKLLDSITPDTLVNRYINEQISICHDLDLMPSNTIIFGLDYTDKYIQYKRGDVNRVCISNLFKT